MRLGNEMELKSIKDVEFVANTFLWFALTRFFLSFSVASVCSVASLVSAFAFEFIGNDDDSQERAAGMRGGVGCVILARRWLAGVKFFLGVKRRGTAVMLKKTMRSVLLVLAISGISYGQENAKPEVIVPQKKIVLLNGKDLSGWYTWLTRTGKADPKQVFAVQENGELRISGDGLGGLTTEREYANYHLVIEYRWGKLTWGSRKEASRDGGVLLHCQGPDGNYGGTKENPGPWMNSLECQIIEGGVGDLLVLPGLAHDGSIMKASATCEVSLDRDGEPVWTTGGEKKAFEVGRVNWFGRDPDWKDVLGYRGKKDVESPGEEWTRLECYCDGNNLTYVVNGVVVNRASQVLPQQGKILLQTEGAEMFVRKCELYPLPKKLP